MHGVWINNPLTLAAIFCSCVAVVTFACWWDTRDRYRQRADILRFRRRNEHIYIEVFNNEGVRVVLTSLASIVPDGPESSYAATDLPLQGMGLIRISRR